MSGMACKLTHEIKSQLALWFFKVKQQLFLQIFTISFNNFLSKLILQVHASNGILLVEHISLMMVPNFLVGCFWLLITTETLTDSNLFCCHIYLISNHFYLPFTVYLHYNDMMHFSHETPQSWKEAERRE